MAINKNFVVKNGIEVNTNLIVADTDSNKVGIGTTVPEYTLHVFEGAGIGVTNITVTGISTNLDELNVGVGGTTLTAISNATLGIGGSVGVGTDAPGYLLEVHSPVSTGQTALYVKGDMRVTGDINIDDISIGDINVSGISTFEGNILIGTAATVGFGSTAFFKDHAKAIFGDGEDLKVYHDGSNSYISDTGTGGLTVGSNSLTIKNAALSETQAVFTENGSVELYHDNSKRFETNAIGVEVSGTFESTGITTLASDAGITTTGGDLYVGGDLYINEDVILDTNLTILGIATIGVLQVSSTSGINTIYSTVQSTNKDTGALVVEGGVGIEKQLYVGAGASVGAGLTAAGEIKTERFGTPVALGADSSNAAIRVGTSASPPFRVDYVGNVVTSGGINVTAGINTFADTTQSSSSTTGAARFAGGVGIEKQLYVGAGASVGAGFTIGTGIGVTTILDDDAFNNASATALASQQSIKAYVDAQITAEDLDFGGDSGTGAVDLDSQTFTIAGTANEIETSASSQTLTIGLPDFVTVSNGLNVTGNGTTTTTLNVSGISTFSEDILIGTAATVGFGSTAFFRDDAKAIFGDGDDLQIYHDGSHSYIRNEGTGNLYIDGDTDDLVLQAGDDVRIQTQGNENAINCIGDGAVELYHNNSKKFETGPAGTITVGVSTADGFEAGDDERIKLGNDQDLLLYHDGSNSYLINETGDLNVRNLADDKDVMIQSDNGSGGFETYIQADGSTRAAKLFNSGSVKFETTSSGVIATGIATAGAGRFTSNLTPLDGQGLELFCPDTSSAQIQSYDRANTQHDKLIIKGNPIEIYDSATKRIETTTSGIINTGITTFSSTSHIKVPSGTTGQRPSAAVAGDFRYNSETGEFEGYTDSWGAIAGGTTETDTAVSSTSATSIYTTPHATNRSVSAIIQITQGTSYQVGRYLVIHDGTTATIVEESAVATGDMLGSFTADINSTNLRILVNMASASSATVTIVPTVVTV